MPDNEQKNLDSQINNNKRWISQVEIKSKHPILPGFTWNMPPFAVISGINGSGKTKFLEAIYDCVNYNRNRPSNYETSNIIKLIGIDPTNLKFFNEIKFIRHNAGFQDLRGETNSAVLDSITSQLIIYLSRKKANEPGFTNNHNYDQIIDVITERSGKKIGEIENEDIRRSIPHDHMLYTMDCFDNQHIAALLKSYQVKCDHIMLENNKIGKLCSFEEACKKIGLPPPWEIINNIFDKYNFHYHINKPETGETYILTFLDKNNVKKTIQFSQLSSGEQIIVTLILWAYNDKLGLKNKVLLLDEFDAHLNPSLSKMLIDVIKNTLVKKFDMQVIMTTHSPSTIAHVDDEDLFWMERGKPIKSSSKKEIIPILANGIMTVREQEADLMIECNIKNQNKPIVFVEGVTDKMILETAWNKIHGKEMPFYFQPAFDCHFIINTFLREKIFNNFPKHFFIGLLDFDDAYNTWKEKAINKNKYEKAKNPNDTIIIYKNKKHNNNGYVMCIPIPELRKNYAGANIKNSYLSIELLFNDEIVKDYCTEQKVSGGNILLTFKDDKKQHFAENIVPTLDAKEFENFKPLFETINNILNNNYTGNNNAA